MENTSKWANLDWHGLHKAIVDRHVNGGEKVVDILPAFGLKPTQTNTMYYHFRRLGIPTNFKSMKNGYTPKKRALGKKTNGRFVTFVPEGSEDTKIEICVGKDIRICVPCTDMETMKRVVNCFRMEEAA